MPSSDIGRDMALPLLYLCGVGEHALEIGVAEHPVGVEAITDRDEPIPERVARPERCGGLEVELAPVRAALVGVHDRLHLAEVGLVLELVVDVDGDIAGIAAVGGAERYVIRCHDANLDREADEQTLALDHGADFAQGCDQLRAWDCVLHLGAPHPTWICEDAVAAVSDLLA